MDVQTYMQTTFGWECKPLPWPKDKSMPSEDDKSMSLRLMSVEDRRMVFAEPGSDERFSVNHMASVYADVYEATGLPVVYTPRRMTVYQRNAMIRARLPFILPGVQVYAPFFGVVYKDRDVISSKVHDAIKEDGAFPPAFQQVWLSMLYSDGPVVQHDLIGRLGISAGTISEAAIALESMELIKRRRDGRQYVLEMDETIRRRSLLKRTWERMRTPVVKTIVVNADDDVNLDALPLAGDSGIAQWSLLGYPYRTVRATGLAWYRANRDRLHEFDVDLENPPDDAIDLQLWAYDPLPWAGVGEYGGITADRISLALAAQKEFFDPRVEQCSDQMMETLFGRTTEDEPFDTIWPSTD